MYKYIFLGTIIFALDRITKLAALAYCSNAAYVVNPYLSFEVVFNRGVSWGMLHSSTTSLFILVSAVIAIITAFLCWHAYYNWRAGNSIIGHTCIIAGSLGNLLDRALYAGVIDFILLSYKTFSWPVFNIADAAIVIGVFVLVFFDEKSA
jgi:signal peptidase II